MAKYRRVVQRERGREREREKVDPHHARFTLKASALGLLEIRAFVLSYDYTIVMLMIYIYIYVVIYSDNI